MPASNKYLVPDKSVLLQKKLEAISDKIQKATSSTEFQTEEQYLFEVIKVISEFYESINQPQLTTKLIEHIRVDDLPDADLYNLLWQKVIDDLTAVFLELENVGDLTVANFNFITTENNRITARLKSVSSKLGDFILYSVNPTKDALFFRDSFNDLSKIEVNSGLLNKPENTVNQTEGTVTLPIDRAQQSLVIVKQTPIINPNSNGQVGNNNETEAPFNGDISKILDNNPDTWFEYERVTLGSTDTKEPLILDLTINLGEETVINHIRINPNNFGTKTVIGIDTIETSLDGEVYTNIKDDIPIAGFVVGDEENVFTLAPSTSKFAGQGLYTFTPRKAKYVHLVLSQTEPFVIDTPAGERLRYAIGIRDIDIRGFKYLPEGEIISRPFETVDEIRKVSVEANQNPAEFSELAVVKYFVSPDDGASWHEIQPRNFPGISGVTTVPEVLTFNGPEATSIVTAAPVRSIRVKLQLKREDDLFVEGSSTFHKRKVSKSELHQVPQDSPFTLQLEQSPVADSIIVVDTLFGSRGLPEAQYILGHASDKLSVRKYRLPFSNLPRPVRKVSDDATPPTYHVEPVPSSEWFHLEAGGEEWTQATQPLASYTLDFDDLNSYKLFSLHVNKGVVVFGDGVTNTLLPSPDQPIGIYFDAERLYPGPTDDDHVAQLDFVTSNNKDDFIIKRYDPEEDATELLPRKATVVRLGQENITSVSGIAESLSELGYDSAAQEFVNGKDEITETTQWSVDTEKGIIYLGSPTSSIKDTSITYTFQPFAQLTNDDWDWATQDLLRDSVSIKESGWKTIAVESEDLATNQNVKVIDLANLSVVDGSIQYSLTISGVEVTKEDPAYPFFKEVPFVDGRSEIPIDVIKTTEVIPALGTGVVSFELRENISTNTADHKVAFTKKNIFVSRKSFAGSPDNLTTVGDYAIDRDDTSPTYGTVRVLTDSNIRKPGKVTYYYVSPNFAENGLYSVDYKLGRIYTQRPIDPLGSGAWELQLNYEYTDYRAEYRIARLIDTKAYQVDVTNNTITFKDSEMLKFMNIPHDGGQGRFPLLPFYLVNYDYVSETREDIDELRDLFSPVVKDYAIRILTKGNIF